MKRIFRHFAIPSARISSHLPLTGGDWLAKQHLLLEPRSVQLLPCFSSVPAVLLFARKR